mgnify:CR=1 FL=1
MKDRFYLTKDSLNNKEILFPVDVSVLLGKELCIHMPHLPMGYNDTDIRIGITYEEGRVYVLIFDDPDSDEPIVVELKRLSKLIQLDK